MEANVILRNQIFEIIKNQIENNDPPETKLTYSRLRAMGYDELETMEMIGQCLAIEFFDIVKHQKPMNIHRFVQNLQLLPKSPI